MRAWAWLNIRSLPGAANQRLKELENSFAELQRRVSSVETLTDGDTTPSVLDGSVLLTANTSPTSITTFDDGDLGHRFTLIFGDADTTLVHGANLQLSGSSNFTGAVGDTRAFATEDGVIWREVPQG